MFPDSYRSGRASRLITFPACRRRLLHISIARTGCLKMVRGFGLAAVLLLLACSNDDDTGVYAERPQFVSMKASDWHFRFSPGMPASPVAVEHGWTFAFPSTTKVCPGAQCPSVHYVVTPSPLLHVGQKVTMIGQVTASDNAVFNHLIEGTDNNTAGGMPSTCRLFLQEAGDNLFGRGAYEYYRWWARADENGIILRNGPFATVVALRPGDWVSVGGRAGDESAETQAGFANALANVAFVGFTCGGGYSYGHGVNMESGTGTFTVIAFDVR